MHVVSEPPILYLGTPVVLISTENENRTYNLAPMSSAFWLGWRCILGLSAVSKTTENLLRTGECVLNVPSIHNVAAVDRLARTTGSNPVPAAKVARGYRHEGDKFGISGLTPAASETVSPPRALECPVQLEGIVAATHIVAEEDEVLRGRVRIFEVRVQRVHVEESILMDGEANRIDPDKWQPLIMSFQRFYGLERRQLHESTLGKIAESLYRTRDVDTARETRIAPKADLARP